MECMYTFNPNTIECKTFHRFEDGKMVVYGYSVERDKSGLEVKRTKPVPLSSIGWDNDKPFTAKDYNDLLSAFQ